MSSSEVMDSYKLVVNKLINAPRETVFNAWTKADVVEKWFAPSPDFKIKVHELEASQGGKYKITMTSPDGEDHTVLGEYQKVDFPERLMFSWCWESEVDQDLVTYVQIDFISKGEQTEVVLTHEGFKTQAACDHHNEGWLGCTGQLKSFYSAN